MIYQLFYLFLLCFCLNKLILGEKGTNHNIVQKKKINKSNLHLRKLYSLSNNRYYKRMFGKSNTNNVEQMEPKSVDSEEVYARQIYDVENANLRDHVELLFPIMMDMKNVKAKTAVLCKFAEANPSVIKEKDEIIYEEWSPKLYDSEFPRMVECMHRADPNFLNKFMYQNKLRNDVSTSLENTKDTITEEIPSINENKDFVKRFPDNSVETETNDFGNIQNSFQNSKYNSIEENPKVMEDIESEKTLGTEMNNIEENPNSLPNLNDNLMNENPSVDQAINSDNMVKTDLMDINENKNSFSNVKDNRMEEVPQVQEELASKNTVESNTNSNGLLRTTHKRPSPQDDLAGFMDDKWFYN